MHACVRNTIRKDTTWGGYLADRDFYAEELLIWRTFCPSINLRSSFVPRYSIDKRHTAVMTLQRASSFFFHVRTGLEFYW